MTRPYRPTGLNFQGRVRPLGISVYDAALDRFKKQWAEDGHVTVSWSGGKDSTVILELAVLTAPDNKKPDVVFYDEELLPFQVIDHVEATAQRDDINFYWCCYPAARQNDMNMRAQDWTTWDMTRNYRQLPEDGYWLSPSDFKYSHLGMAEDRWQTEALTLMLSEPRKMTLGMRATESTTRLWNAATNRQRAYWPIYDWHTSDVWLAFSEHDWDYCSLYDIEARRGLNRRQVRIAPPLGMGTINNIPFLAEHCPELWTVLDDMADITEAINNAESGHDPFVPCPGEDWVEHITHQAKQWQSISLLRRINAVIRRHRKRTSDPILPRSAHPLTGLNLRHISRFARSGGRRGRMPPLTNVSSISPRHYKNARKKQALRKVTL